MSRAGTRAVFQRPAACLVRQVPASFTRALRSQPVELSVATAREQHASYVQALRDAGVDVVTLPGDESTPDCCFIEDAAVVLSGRALITRPGAPTREPEVPPVRNELASSREVLAMHAPATLDGGDVLRAGAVLFVGVSSRTNEAGVARLAECARDEGLRVVPVPVSGGLHLKSVCSLAGPELLVYFGGALDLAPFAAEGLACLEVPEPAGANVLALGGTVLVSSDAPRTAELLAARCPAVKMVTVSEFHRADGALTCLSIRLPQAGTWVT